MTMERVQPFALLFGAFRDARLPAIRAALGDNSDVNAFMLAAPALELLRDLRPDEGLGPGIDDFVALVHAGYLFWRDGENTITLDETATRKLPHPERSEGAVGTPPAARSLDKLGTRELSLGATYVQIAPHIIWGQLDPDAAFEPLDGWFATPTRDGTLRMVACFGVHAQRPGVSVVAVQGGCPAITARDDGTRPFAPTMPGGNAAHLHAVATADELLLLGWRGPNNGGI